MRIDQVMLGEMIGAQAVGLYAAAVKLAELWSFVPGAITISVFPSIIAAKNTGVEMYGKRMQQLYDLMALLSIGIAVVITILSREVMGFLYGSAFIEASSTLMVYIWSGVATFLGIASSQFLTAENLTRISLYRTLIGMILNVLLNLLLIPSMGIVGAAVATLISYTAATFSVAFFSASRSQAAMMLKSLVVFRILFERRSKENAE
jgi:O-antigen/teichoic acid export membrane protein